MGQANRFQFGGNRQVFGRCSLRQGGHLTSHSSGQRDVPKSLAFAALILCQTFRAATLPLNSSVMAIKNMIRVITLAILSILAVGCYPINKTLQPTAKITVVDERGDPVRGAEIVLISNAFPYGFERSRMLIRTNQNGHSYFPQITEWRIESLMIHGSDVYFWNWCVFKEGYETFTTSLRNAKNFNSDQSVVLKRGDSKPCPKDWY